MKTSTLILLIITLFTAAGCGKQDSSQKPDPPSMTLQTAAALGEVKVIEQHIKAGSDLNAKDDYGSTPLIVAATFNKPEAARVLIEAGADMTITNPDGSNPLHIAAFFCRPEIVEYLLEAGADKSILNGTGKTALETVSGPFEEVKPIYDYLQEAFGPLGLVFDYEYIKATRPKIAEMLR
jgi:hypothetical protein